MSKFSKSWPSGTGRHNEITHRVGFRGVAEPSAAGTLPQTYATARARAIAATGLADDPFPTACPFTLDEVLSRSFLPQP